MLDLISPRITAFAGTKLNIASRSPFSTTENETPYNDVTHYNNFYEFGTDKTDPAKNATRLRTSPWTVNVTGAVSKPQKFDIDALLKLAPLEERIYRHRCVEAWSIVVPWIGYPLSALLKQVEPHVQGKVRGLPRASTIPARCRRRATRASRFLTSRDCGWTKP